MTQSPRALADLTVDGMETALEIVRTYCQQKEDEYQRVIGREHFREQALSLKDAKLAGEVIAHRIETAIKAVSLRAQAPAQPLRDIGEAEFSADQGVSAPAREQGEAVAWLIEDSDGVAVCRVAKNIDINRFIAVKKTPLYAAPASAHQAVELERYNVALAEESRILRNVIDDLVEAFDASADMDEMDGPEYQEASAKLEAAINAARTHTEQAIIQKAIDLAALPRRNRER